MSSPSVAARAVALLLALSFAAPLAAAHADPAETVYDPLTLDLPGWLWRGGIERTAPAQTTQLEFPGYAPGSTPVPLDFSAAMPERFAPKGGLAIHLALVALKPVAAQDASGSSLRVALLSNGAPVTDASRDFSFGKALLAPGDTAELSAILPLPNAAFLFQERLDVRITPLMPALADGSLALVMGPDASRADFPGARLFGVEDIGLEEPSEARVLLIGNDTPPAPGNPSPGVVFSVTENETRALTPLASARLVWITLRGDHSIAEARAYHEGATPQMRHDAAEVFRVGTTRVRVHPGLAITLRVEMNPGSVVDVTCESCANRYHVTLLAYVPDDGSNVGSYDPSNVLIPPPRATSGIPVSEDAPPEKKAPGPEAALLVGGLAAAALLARYRRR